MMSIKTKAIAGVKWNAVEMAVRVAVQFITLAVLARLLTPDAFGLLFGIGLYDIYQKRGDDFIPEYKNLLASTGEGNAIDLAAGFGIDIGQPKFWEDSLKVIGKRIERYATL